MNRHTMQEGLQIMDGNITIADQFGVIRGTYVNNQKRFKTEIPSYQKEIKDEYEFNMGDWEKVDIKDALEKQEEQMGRDSQL